MKRLLLACNICKDSDQCISHFETCRVSRAFVWQCMDELCLTIGVIWLMLQMDFIPAVMVGVLKSIPPSEASRFMNSLPVPAKQENPLGSSPALAPVTLGNQCGKEVALFRTSLPCGWGNVGHLGSGFVAVCLSRVVGQGETARRSNSTGTFWIQLPQRKILALGSVKNFAADASSLRRESVRCWTLPCHKFYFRAWTAGRTFNKPAWATVQLLLLSRKWWDWPKGHLVGSCKTMAEIHSSHDAFWVFGTSQQVSTRKDAGKLVILWPNGETAWYPSLEAGHLVLDFTTPLYLTGLFILHCLLYLCTPGSQVWAPTSCKTQHAAFK